MNELDYKPNSHKAKEEQAERKKVEKVVRGTVKTKKNDIRKLADVFISEDVKNVKSYVLMDVLVPTIKKAIVDIVTDGVNMIFFGGRATRKSGSTISRVSYRDYYDSRDDRTESSTSRNAYNYDDIILETRQDAEEVLTSLDEMIATYGKASVADLYDAVGITGDYTDNRYGWTNLSSAEPIRVRDGWKLRLPRAKAFNR